MCQNSHFKPTLLLAYVLFSCFVLPADPEAETAIVYEEKAFLPAWCCCSVDISPDRGTIYARSHFGDWNEGVRLYSGATYTHMKDFEHLPNVPWTILASADGSHLYASYYYGGAVVKLNASTGEVVKSISVGPWPNRMAFDSARRYLYVCVNCPGRGAVGWISVIDTSTDAVVGRADLNGEPNHCLVLSPDEQFLYVGTHQVSPETLYKIGTSNLSVVKTLAMPGIGIPAMSGSPEGNFLYLADDAAGVVRIIETGSLTQTGSYSIPHVQNFSVAPSGDHAIAACYATGSSDALIQVLDLPTGTVVQTLTRTLTATKHCLWGACSILWDATTGEAYISLYSDDEVNGGVVVLSLAAGGPEVVYQTDFSTNPQWVTDQPDNYYWNESAGTYHAKVENNAPGYRPNRYFYKAVTGTGGSLEVEWDVKITRMDWSAGVCFGLFDENLALGGFEGGQGVQLVFGHPDEGLVLAFYAMGASGLAQGDSKPGPRYSIDAWYTCKIRYDAAVGEVSVDVKVRNSGTSLWSKSLSVPGGFARPLVRLGGSWSGFGETSGGYRGVNRWAVAEADIDNVVFRRPGGEFQPPEEIFADDFERYARTEDAEGLGHWVIESVSGSDAAWQLKATDGSLGNLRNELPDLDGVSGKYMISDSDMAQGVEGDEMLMSPEINCRRYAGVTLSFATNIRVYDSQNDQIFDVDVSVFDEEPGQWGGWQNVFRRDRNDGNTNSPQNVDISRLADGKKIKLRWRYYRANFDWWWAIDDVEVTGMPGPVEAPTIFRSADGFLTLTWQPFGDGSYFLEWTNDLSSGEWFVLQEKGEWPISATSWALPSAPEAKKRFYRIGSGIGPTR